jgi:uncharacterized membrane protein YeaQ/YmgE (transglycosylase-associated protein family)
MNNTALAVHLVSGVIGGNLGGLLAGSLRSDYNLGPVGNSIAGVVGGGLISAFVSFFPANLPTSMSSVNLTSISLNALGGGLGGIVTTVVVGIIKSRIGGTKHSGC